MTALLLIAFLLFAPVAGASTYRCATENEAITTHSEYDVARFIGKQGAFCRNMDIDQPAEETKPHVTGPATLVKSESEEWREKCEEWTEKADDMSWHAEKKMILYSYFCTRYNAALLKEMKENTK